MPPKTAPKAATKQDGPQAVGEYTYPPFDFREEHGTTEIVTRHVRVRVAPADAAGGLHEVDVDDAYGGLPVVGQPRWMEFGMTSRYQLGTGITLHFGRAAGSTGPYELCGALPDGEERRRPATRAR